MTSIHKSVYVHPYLKKPKKPAEKTVYNPSINKIIPNPTPQCNEERESA